MNIRFAVAALGLVSLVGCASIEVKKPDIHQVKKIAIVSVTSNFHIYETEEKNQKQSDSDLAALGKTVFSALTNGGKSDAVQAQVKVVTHGAAELSKMFSNLNGWTLLPVADVIANPNYSAQFAPQANGKVEAALAQVFDAMATSDWVVPQGMGTIPLEEVAPSSNAVVVNLTPGSGGRDEAEIKAGLAKLAADLGVDAVVVAEVKLSYKKPFISVSSGGLFMGLGATRTTRTPVVEINVAVVNALGNVVLKSKRGWKVFEGPDAPILAKDQIDLADEKGEGVKAYNQAIDASVKALSELITKAL